MGGLGSALKDRDDGVGPFSEGEHMSEEVQVQEGHVAGDDDGPVGLGSGEAGEDAAQGALARVAVHGDLG